jgi:hypothetical protein
MQFDQLKRREFITLLSGAVPRPESAVSALLLAACRLLTRGLLSGLC